MKCKIKERREEVGISQGQLARKVGTSREQMNRIERGKIKNPGITTCKKIAEALWTTVESLWV